MANNDLTLKKMVEQMIITGFHSSQCSNQSDINHILKNFNIGGVILFDYNNREGNYKRNITSPNQLKKLTTDLQEHSETPLFIAIDQEGGKVCRLKEEKGFNHVESAYDIGIANDNCVTRNWSIKVADDLSRVGINLNLAPVVDLALNENNPAIAKLDRSFSSNAEEVVYHAGIFCETMREYGVMSCLKHFPGQGSAATDTHLQLTDTSSEWTEYELIPFKELISKNACDMVMTGHLYNDNLDDKYAATLSYKTIQNLLREKLGWQGLVISDDLQMKAISRNFPLSNTLMLAINAGVDLLLFANNNTDDLMWSINNITQTALSLIKNGKINITRIEESYNRIIDQKKKMGLM